MKTLKYILLAIVALAGFTACSDDATETPSGINGYGVYFPATAPESVLLAQGQNVVSVPIMRTESEGAFSTRVIFNPGEDGVDIFSANTAVNFADGETVASIDITFDFNDVKEGTKYVVSLGLSDESNTSAYGRSLYTFTMLYDPWDDLCKATFIDNAAFTSSYTVQVQRKTGTTNRFRLVDPYSQGLAEEYEGEVTTAPSEYLEFIVQDGLVYYDNFQSGVMDEDEGVPIIYSHPSTWSKYPDESYWQYNCELAEGFYHIAPLRLIGDTGYLYDNSQMMGVIYIIFDTADLSDTSVECEYLGSYTAPDEDETKALVNVALGEDTAYVQYAVTSGNLEEDPDALQNFIDGIAGGSIESEQLEESGVVQLALPEMGLYTFAAVSFDAAGEAKDFDYAVFAFAPSGGGLPECEFSLVAGLDNTNKYDPSSYIVYTVAGTDIAKVWAWREPISEIERYGLKESDYAAWTQKYGWDIVAAGYLDYVNDPEGFPGVFGGLEAGAEYVVMVYAVNSYGKGKLETVKVTTAEGSVKWESIGMGVYYDDFMFGLISGSLSVTVPVDVEILQATEGVDVPTYRIMYPFPLDLMDMFINDFGAGDAYAGRPDPFIQFSVEPAADGSQNEVYFEPFYNGQLYSGHDILCVHPNDMTDVTVDGVHNIERAEGIYQFAPVFFVEALSSGFNYSGYDDLIVVTLPGHDLSEIDTELVPYPLAASKSLSGKSKSELFRKMRVAPYVSEMNVKSNASSSARSEVALPVEKKSAKIASSVMTLKEASRLMKPVRM